MYYILGKSGFSKGKSLGNTELLSNAHQILSRRGRPLQGLEVRSDWPAVNEEGDATWFVLRCHRHLCRRYQWRSRRHFGLVPEVVNISIVIALNFPTIRSLPRSETWACWTKQELTFAPHLNRLGRDCFYQLRLLVARSLSTGPTATLVHSLSQIALTIAHPFILT